MVAPIGATTLFAVGTSNVGDAGDILISVLSTPGLIITLCQTDAVGACLASSPPSGATSISYAANSSASFAVFVTPTTEIENDPANNRISIRFTESSGVLRGATSTAVRTQ